MRRFLGFFIGLLLGGGLTYFGFSYHVVYAEEGLLLVQKEQAALSDIVVNIRGWDAGEWQQHFPLARSVIKHGRSDLISGPVADQLMRGVLNGYRGATEALPDFE